MTEQEADVVRRLIGTSQNYCAAAQEHHEATFMDDAAAMARANRKAEKAYSRLSEAQAKARALLEAQGGVFTQP